MRLFQLTSKTRLAVGDPSECEEAVLKVTRQKGTVLQVFDRLSLGVQHSLYSLDDFIAVGQEEVEKFDVCLKRHLARTRSGWPLFGRKEGMKGQASQTHVGPYRLMPARSMVSRRSRFLVGTTVNERYANRETALILPIVMI